MKKRNQQREPINTENTTRFDPASGPSNSELQFNVSHPLSGPRPTGQPPILHLNHRKAVNTPPLAARGNADLEQKPDNTSAPKTSESITQRDPESGPTNSELQFNFSHPLSGPRPTAQSTFNQLDPGMPAYTPPLAAKGDDDLMSQKQKQS